MAFDSHLTNGRNHSQTVCGAERALSITLAGLRLQDSQCIHFHMDGLPWGDPSGSRFATIWLPGGVLVGSSISEVIAAFLGQSGWQSGRGRGSQFRPSFRVRQEKRIRLRWLQATFFCCCASEIGGLAKTSAGLESKPPTAPP